MPPSVHFFCGKSRDQAKPIGNLLLADAAKAAGQFQGGQNFRPSAGKKLNVVGQILGLVEMPADQQDGAIQFLAQCGDDGTNASAPQSRHGRGGVTAEALRKIFQLARSKKPPDSGGNRWFHDAHIVAPGGGGVKDDRFAKIFGHR